MSENERITSSEGKEADLQTGQDPGTGERNIERGPS